MRDQANLVIIGAGIVGCSAAYHLTKLGWQDVVVIDQGPLYETGGSTSHAPGIIFGTNPSYTMSKMAQYTVKLLDGLEYEGEPCWFPVGTIEVATTEARMQELWRRHGYNTAYGAENYILSPREIQDRVPLIDPTVLKGGMFLPHDGVGQAWKLAGALAQKAIASGGAEFFGNTLATSIELKNGRTRAVVTDQGRIECDRVLLCTNIWGSVLAGAVGVSLPMMACAHQYAITEPLPELAGEMRWVATPAVRHQDRSMYFRQWEDAYCTGSYRHEPRLVSPNFIGQDAYHTFRDADFKVAIQDANQLYPALRGRKYLKKVNGMFVFSTDGFPIIGPTQVPGFWTAIGIWVTHSGGAGKLIAEWMTTGATEWDSRELDVSRFHDHQKTRTYIELRSAQNYREVYDIIHPWQQMENPRNLRLVPYHARLQEQKAVFFEGAGWERPQWFEANAGLVEEYEILGRSGWAARFWSPIQGAEHQATRDRVALYDLTAFTKIEVSGPGALAYLNGLAANQIDQPPGRVVYTSLLNARGGIKADLTITRLGPDRFLVLTGGGMGMLDLAWLRSHVPGDGSLHITDLSSNYCALGLWGPKARDVLQQLADEDVSNEAFPYFTARHITIGTVPILALRVSYVGELGWELYTRTEFGLKLWDTLWAAGQPHGLIAAGGGAFDSLRLEKGYRLWGNDIHTDYNPFEAGLSWTVKLDKGDFLGREALLRIKAAGIRRKLCCMTLDDPSAVVVGKEPIFAGDRVLGYVTSANTGHTIDRCILYGYLPLEYATVGTSVAIQYFDGRYPATVVNEPLYDPQGEKLRI
jgi:dimethylglycine oxidase